jgi:Flp pilus assembly protein TadG
MIHRTLVGLRSLLSRFARAKDGAAAVEFALILPFMLALYAGSIELSDMISVDRRITVISSTVGDLVSRMDGDIYETELNDYFTAAEEIISPYVTTGLKQLITCVKVDAAGTVATVVQWSKASGGATLKSTGSILTLPIEITVISKNKYVIVSETQYSYKPMMGIVFQNTLTMYRQNFHLPRFGDNVVWKSGSRP